ncbi:hypothetical protein RGI145_24195 (plasmid) [Roseomonas gilardii]|uniref:G domain-containing protein n=1 Tax=Roseomonas gilardii TaxID=257708 RepID=A0A1L7ANW4_9PROT|nr:DUF697 domain-containing protein [Roseomonas gilardii]APT60449.1 hypothetical protein RGI145_24195 [Roseomonas gilardii]
MVTASQLLLADLTALFMASSSSELGSVDLALSMLSPDPTAVPSVRQDSKQPDRCPYLLAEATERFVRSARRGWPGFGEPQADLAALALMRAGLPVPRMATIPELEKEVLTHLPALPRDALQQLALEVAGLRHRKLRRAGMLRMPAEARILRRPADDGPGWLGHMTEAVTDAGQRVFDLGREMLGDMPFMRDFEKKAEEAVRKLGKANILVAGRSGVGKSTLINAVFGREVAKVGMGRPVTQDITWFEPEGLPVRLCDTKGLEMVAFDATLAALAGEIEKAHASGRAEDRIHVLWLCIDEPGARIQDGEVRVAELCARHRIPVIVVLTKAIGPRAFAGTVRKILPDACGVVRVLVEPWDDQPPFGLPELVKVTLETLTFAKAAFEAAQQVDLTRKRETALKIAAAASATAAAAAAVPVPVADAAGVFAANTGMITGIAAAMGVRMTRDNILTLAGSMVGALAVAGGGRLIAGQVLKLIPGIGSVVGGIITAGIAASATYGLGYGFIEFLCRYHTDAGRMPEGEELREGFQRFWETWKEKEKRPPGDAAAPAPA